MSEEPETYEDDEQDWLDPDSVKVVRERAQRPDYATNAVSCEACE